MPKPSNGALENDSTKEWWAIGWSHALMRLNGYEKRAGLAGGLRYTGKYDAKPLAGMLLASWDKIPEQVATELALMLAPPRPWRGPRLKLIAPPSKRTHTKYSKDLNLKRNARLDYLKLLDSGLHRKEALYQVQEKYGVKRTWVTEAVALTDEKWIAATRGGAPPWAFIPNAGKNALPGRFTDLHAARSKDCLCPR